MSVKVTPEMVKQLRERTGVGMGKCKEALDQAGGNMNEAIDILRKAGLASAVKKEGREANEGLIGTAESPGAVALVEVNAETDFVVQNEQFKQFLALLAQEVAGATPQSVQDLLARPYSKDPSLNLDQHRALVMQSLGENIQVKRLLVIPKSKEQSIGIYSHMGGRIIAAVVLSGGGAESLARDIAMHVAAEAPEYLSSADVPQSVRDKEAEIARGQLVGKPANMIDKIIEGKVRAFCDQVCLVQQKYVRDNTMTITDLLAKESKQMEKPLAIQTFYRWKVGG